jgi:hypothetical protein
LKLGAVGAGLGGGIDQPQGQLQAAVVVVADLGDHEGRRVSADRPASQIQLAPRTPGHGHHPPVVIEQGDHLDLLGEERGQVTAGRALGRGHAAGVHGGGHRQAQINAIAAADPAAEVAVAEHALEDARFRHHEDQAGFVGRDLVQGGEDRVFGEDDELGEVALDLYRLHRMSFWLFLLG